MKLIHEIKITPDRTPSPVINVEKNIQVSLSPFDFPNLAKLLYDDPTRHFRIEFVYLTTEEPTIEYHPPYSNVYMEVGKSSKKLYALGIHKVDRRTEGLDDILAILNEITAGLEAALRKCDVKQPKDRLPYLNFSFARNFLSFERNNLNTLIPAL